ncbi:nucleotide sugar dehydrogenase [Stappia sp. BW2]|jgi:GDP-mannose 6-dehydrogenase|uniref:nucleotide sugar dehydrogenase n=1 Tax=Stappia sp. BW2 TaxID=2592622 RepID=UPI0011DEB197|nr:nucleotide sugar dehydrogenase [Stappia sp. BW2]TYC64042.1 nucleotide sugar dehydrogenase [Stappia sp. BW2]
MIDFKSNDGTFSISVVGAGYVGCVSAACLCNDGYNVVAMDVSATTIERLANGKSPIIEPGLDELIAAGHEKGTLKATTDIEEAVRSTNMTFCCVGTPSLPNGTLNTGYVKQVSEDIGRVLRDKDEFHIVVMRSTILPGTMEEVVLPALAETSGKVPGVDFGVAYYPEFLRESTAIDDYYSPGAIVFGQYGDDTRSIDALKSLVAHIPVVPHVIPMRSGEIVKYANNCWHAVKISFANEIGNLCKSKDIDSHDVLEVLCADTRLNISKAYMKPGFAFGGSCLPKDLRALTGFGRLNNVPTPMLDAAYSANLLQIDRAKKLVNNAGKNNVGFMGVTFKENTDDLRESPMVELVETFLGKGKQINIYDPNVVKTENGGRNYLPHIAPLVCDTIDDVVARSEIVVIGNKYPGLAESLSASNKELTVIDLARVSMTSTANLTYHGLCW